MLVTCYLITFEAQLEGKGAEISFDLEWHWECSFGLRYTHVWNVFGMKLDFFLSLITWYMNIWILETTFNIALFDGNTFQALYGEHFPLKVHLVKLKIRIIVDCFERKSCSFILLKKFQSKRQSLKVCTIKEYKTDLVIRKIKLLL